MSALVFGILSYFHYADSRLPTMLDHLASQQMADGGWNCRYPRWVTHASFHTTLLVLNGLAEYARFQPVALPKVCSLSERAHEFLSIHRPYKSHRTGKVLDAKMTRLTFPPQWYYHVHMALDYFQGIGQPYDPRFEEAIALLKSKEKDGRWPLHQGHPQRVWLQLEQVGEMSRINTLIAMRILQWWGGARG